MLVENPILRGFHPDPSPVLACGVYYLAVSTFEWFPGVRIYRSQDLVHWTYTCAPLDSEDKMVPEGTMASDGVWTPHLSFDGERFYLLYTVVHGARRHPVMDVANYYWDGITPSVAVLVKAVDRERMAVAHAFGVEILSAEEWLRQSYDTYGDDLYQLLQHNQAYGDIQAPHTIQARYVTEDVPMSLVPISELGHIAGVPTPNIDSVITLTSTIYQRDFRGEGRNAVNLGIQEMTLEQVAHYFETGKKETQPLLMGERKTEAAS